MTHIRTMVITALLMPALCACTVMQLKNQVDSDEVRVASKEEALKTEEARQAKLQQEVKALQQDLASRQMSLDDLKSRLSKLEQANANTVANTEKQRILKRQRQKKLQAHQEEVVKIEQSSESIEEKKERVKYLQEEIRKSLASQVYS